MEALPVWSRWGLEAQSPPAPLPAFEAELGFPSFTLKLESNGASLSLPGGRGEGKGKDAPASLTTNPVRRV